MITTKYFRKLLVCCGIILCLLVSSCDKDSENPNTPSVYINIKINPNSTMYQELNTVSGWMYLTATTPSRGIIVYRYSMNEFIAYERTPPNEPDNCCDENGNCSRLVVDFPFVVDKCNDNLQYIKRRNHRRLGKVSAYPIPYSIQRK